MSIAEGAAPSAPAAPLPEIPFSAATGEVRLIYDALAKALGVRLVNLVYRHLATLPGGLEWAWSVICEPYLDGTLARRSPDLIRAANFDARKTKAEGVLGLSRFGLNNEEVRAVLRTIDAYNMANPMNAISLQILTRELASDSPPPGYAPPPAVELDLKELLPLQAFHQLPADTRETLRHMSHPFLGKNAQIVPSLFLHLAPWPGLLRALADLFAGLRNVDAVEAAVERVSQMSTQIGMEIHADRMQDKRSGGRLSDDTYDAISTAVETFFPAICRMIVVGNFLRRVLRA